jgi:hypothetical protein
MIRASIQILLLVIFFSITTYSQNYSGPAVGTVSSGGILNTNSFSTAPTIENPVVKTPRNTIKPEIEPMYYDFGFDQPDLIDFYHDDESVLGIELSDTTTVLLNSFHGLDETNSIPPDPALAVGPNHVMAVVNSDFGIFDKNGNLEKRINADSWYGYVFSGAGSFDPKVLYDHYNNRWIMVWLHHEDSPQESFVFVSVSDDDDPHGEWYNWAIPGNKNGNNNSGNWTDYQGVGFDQNHLIITSNQFTFAPSSFQYVRIRIVNLHDMYNNTTAGSIDYTDLWDIRYPHNTQRPFNIRPSFEYDTTDSKYFLLHMPSGSANFYSLYTLDNLDSSPSLSGVNVSIPFYSSPPATQQLGGGSPPIDDGGGHQRFEPTYRDGKLYCVHAIRNPAYSNYSAVHYNVIDVSTAQSIERGVFGAEGFFYMYPTIAVDKYGNIASSFSRVSNTTYAGGYYATKLAYEAPGFTRSYVLQEGRANYVKTYGGSRNRWGDYQGAWLDPANMENIWFLNEFVSSDDTWDTWIGEIRMIPYQGVAGLSLTDSIDFGNIEVSFGSDTLSAYLTNYGDTDLSISSIDISDSQFQLVSIFTYPLIVEPYDTVEIFVEFLPTDRGDYETYLDFNSNDPNLVNTKLKARGYIIDPTVGRKMYAATGSGGGGLMLDVDPDDANSTELGFSRYYDIIDMAIDPNDDNIYGLRSTDPATIVRVNATYGDSYDYITTTISNAQAIAFDTIGNCYVASRNGDIYEVDITDGTSTPVTTSQSTINAIAVNPVTNELYASYYQPIGSGRDLIYKIDLATGDTTHFVRIGVNSLIKAMTFDEYGMMYASIDSVGQSSKLYKVANDGTVTRVGGFGFDDVTSIEYNNNVVVGVEDENNTMPAEFALKQNFPNPFNPSTTIEFSLPVSANVRLAVYNLLGEQVKLLANSYYQAGTHKVVWNADDNSGKTLSSGVYFYEMRADGDQQDIVLMKKMLLLR